MSELTHAEWLALTDAANRGTDETLIEAAERIIAAREAAAEQRGRVNVRDTLDTWPSLSVTIETAPWHWAWLPRIYNDWDCTSSCSVAWLFLKVEWFANRPLLPLERTEATS